MNAISATELARNAGEVLDRVAKHGETIVVERNRTAIARLIPSEPTMTATQALAGLQVMLKPRQATLWLKQSKVGFDQKLRDPWA